MVAVQKKKNDDDDEDDDDEDSDDEEDDDDDNGGGGGQWWWRRRRRRRRQMTLPVTRCWAARANCRVEWWWNTGSCSLPPSLSLCVLLLVTAMPFFEALNFGIRSEREKMYDAGDNGQRT